MRESDNNTDRIETNLGDLIASFYQEFLELYGDPELASVATATIINDLMAESTGADGKLPQVA